MLEVFGFSTLIQKAALFTATSRYTSPLWHLAFSVLSFPTKILGLFSFSPILICNHFFVQPTKILISAAFQAKLLDFGLSKVMTLDQSYVSSEVRGTFGYVDLEYQINHHVNSSGDIYSLGIILLQILSGQRVLNLNSKKPMSLDKMVRRISFKFQY